MNEQARGSQLAQAEVPRVPTRRGLIAGLTALVAAGLAKLASPERAEAADGAFVQTGVTADGTNPSANPTWIRGNVSGKPAFRVTQGSIPFSGFVRDAADGIQGYAQAGGQAGVLGRNDAAGGIGVLAQAPLGTPILAATIFGNSNPAIFAQSTGTSATAISALSDGNGIAIEGDAFNSIGVVGRAILGANPNPGVLGSATNGYGVFGFSQNSNGIAGQSGTSAAGCVGFAGAPGGYGIYGGTAVAGGYAGGFAGPVLVNGAFTVVNGPKNAAVPHPDGSHRLLYCQESPEPWFEDFGEGRLVGGRAEVRLEADYAAVVQNEAYRVFLTPEGDCRGLYVSTKAPTGFEVRELQGGTSTLTFSYRVVAKRRDIPGPRLDRVKLPEPLKELVKPDLPKPPEPRKLPEDSKPPQR